MLVAAGLRVLCFKLAWNFQGERCRLYDQNVEEQ